MPATRKPAKPAAAAPAVRPAVPAPASAPASNGTARRGPGSLPSGMGQNTGSLSFAAAPPKSRRGAGASGRWNDTIAQLKANAGQWAVLGTYTSAGNRPSPLKDAGITMKTVRVMDADGSPAFVTNADGTQSPMFELWGSFNPAE